MKLIKGKYEKALREHETIRDYEYNIGDYFLEKERGFIVSLNQIVFNEDWKDEDLTDIAIDDYTEIKEIAIFSLNDYEKNISCKYMRQLIQESRCF